MKCHTSLHARWFRFMDAAGELILFPPLPIADNSVPTELSVLLEETPQPQITTEFPSHFQSATYTVEVLTEEATAKLNEL
ncbi:hypothetical protein AV530_013341 [Patagioenas fasciata monilis]|uniref:Uncharacterized protein n=1 Tax=Patagioenas fasciata monilis TaxID=372326 RepID=A0A1V4JP03_PATFA|nr:hypothetical protein AV530_013341 [Patagioenas fasciata monilis]